MRVVGSAEVARRASDNDAIETPIARTLCLACTARSDARGAADRDRRDRRDRRVTPARVDADGRVARARETPDTAELGAAADRTMALELREAARAAFEVVSSASTLTEDAMEAFAAAATAPGVVERADVRETLTATRDGGATLLDARSPGEFAKGHIPGAVNVPLFDNDTRAEVGKTYKTRGRGEAMVLGMTAVAPQLDALVEAAVRAIAERGAKGSGGKDDVKDVYVMCFRGGMRSSCVGWLLSEKIPGVRVRVLSGGYKGFRKWALERCGALDVPAPKVCIVGGRTGVGKTRALLALEAKGEQIIDLEGLANHAGSAFGWVGREPQPTSEHYSNMVVCTWDALDPTRWVYIEDEGPHVGRCSVDPLLFVRMRNAPLVIRMVASRDMRLHTLVEDYATDDLRSNPEWLPTMEESIEKLTKRLGGLRVKEIRDKLEGGDFTAVAEGLLDYYDELYDKHLMQKRKDRRGRGGANDETSSVTSFSSTEEERAGVVVDVHCRAREDGAIDEESLVRNILCAVGLFDCQHGTIEEYPSEEG